MSTTLTAIVIALVGVLAVLAVAGAFYLVGRAEDRDREAARRPPEPEPGAGAVGRGPQAAAPAAAAPAELVPVHGSACGRRWSPAPADVAR